MLKGTTRSRLFTVKIALAGEIPLITKVSKQGSHMLSSITHAEGYIILEPGETLVPNSLKEVFLF